MQETLGQAFEMAVQSALKSANDYNVKQCDRDTGEGFWEIIF